MVCEFEALKIFKLKTDNDNEILEEILTKTINTLIMKIDI